MSSFKKSFSLDLFPELKKSDSTIVKSGNLILAVASSTGGVEALKIVLTKLPSNIPGVLVVQHIPAGFSKVFAKHLNELCPFEVKEAESGDIVRSGRVLIAPGDYHMELMFSGVGYCVRLQQGPAIQGVRPAADILMKSVAKFAGANSMGLILTGIGKDGAQGLLEMKKAGSYNIGQDEKSCVVYGMPKEAADIGALHQVLPLDEIPLALANQFELRCVG